MNSRLLYGPNRLNSAMGTNPDGTVSEHHLIVLKEMEEFLKSFDLFNFDGSLKVSELPWQHGIMCSIFSTRKLYLDLVVNGNFEFLLTSRLNQDCLENFFSGLRGNYISKVFTIHIS